MPVELWIGQPFDTTHEREALESFMTDMESSFGQDSKLYMVLANFYVDGKQVDLAVLKNEAIIVIELKKCDLDDPFVAQENGPWVTDSGRKIETDRLNPFEQVNKYRKNLMSLLSTNQKKFLPSAKIGSLDFTHIKGYVVIDPSLPPGTKNNIPDNKPWFRLVGLNRLTNAIDNAVSQRLNFLDEELHNLVTFLNLRPAPGTIKHLPYKRGNLPAKPSLLIGREEATKQLKQRLGILNGKSPSSQVITAMRGWPGVGKTTLAAAFAHDPDVQEVFSDGVLWAALGENPQLFDQLLAWGRALGIDNLSTSGTVEEISTKLSSLLNDQKMLLIIDDVWQTTHALPFQVGGRNCATLFTTRFSDVARQLAPTSDDVYNLSVLSEEKSLELLAKIAPTVVEQYPQASLELVRDLEGLPLAIRVAGGLLNEETHLGWSVTDLLVELRESTKILEAQAPADRVDLATQTIPTVAVLLQKSTDRLSPETRDCFAFLGAFAPKPATFSVEDMAAVWTISNPKPIVRQLVDRGLLEPIDGRFQMHALLVMHAESLLEE